ncbi:MAG: enoyl-CoA hydratase/isomerase family protein [Pseudonocardiaceae bacterium]|nr:enoyl-CoA hydratase/isomerase family protein [Pseudonocardiaceae bacterium]
MLDYETADGVATVTLNRPERMNALSSRLCDELVAAFDRAHRDPAVRAVVLAAVGERGFCAGRDLHEAGESDAAGEPIRLPMRGVGREVFEAIVECGKPTVAALFGYTLGGGAELALACDVRIAADDLTFGFPEVVVGFGANFGSVMLPRVAPLGVAYDLLYTGRRIGAAEAKDCFVVNQVVARGELSDAVADYVDVLTTRAPLTQQRYKAMITKGRELPLSAALRLDAAPNPYLSEDRKEGVAAWREGRRPRWQGR